MYAITIVDEANEVLNIYYTDEALGDIQNAIEHSLAVYGSKEELDAANAEDASEG